MSEREKTFHKAAVLLGKAEKAPSIVEAVQFHGINVTKNDALVQEVAELYRCKNLDDVVHNSHLAARHLQEVGLMDNAIALIDTAPSNNGYIVNFIVKEPKPFTLGVKAGMSTNGDADVSVNASRNSVGGRGETVNASYTYTVKGDHSFNLGGSKPFLGWQKYSNIGTSIYRSIAYLPWNQANLEENALIGNYNGQLLNKKLLHSVKLNAIWRTLRASNDSAFAVREHAGHTVKFSIENSLAYDTRDRPILASQGLLLRFAQEYAGPFGLGDSSFVRHQFDFQAATKLPLHFVLAASFQAKAVRSLADREIHLLDRVYLGGQQDIRGFGLNTLGMRADASFLGGGTSVAGVVHLYRPLFPADMLFAHAFIASGSVASVRSRQPLRDIQDSQRVSAGVGVSFVFKNIFRLELNYVHPLKFVPGDSMSRGFHIGAGVNFL